MIQGLDLSHWQNPEKMNWSALKAAGYQFIIARANYGKGAADRNFVRFAELARLNGLKFSAYLFYRQIHTVEEQLELFDTQLKKIGGLQPGDLFPALDMEDNSANGDGKPNAGVFNSACFKIADSWRHKYGGTLLYYSSLFPASWLGLDKGAWRNQPGFYHWLADYSRPVGQPRHPDDPSWHIHQPQPRTIPEYAGGKELVDYDVLSEGTQLVTLTIPETEPTTKDETDTSTRPGGADIEHAVEKIGSGTELIAEGLNRMREGLELLKQD
jgi:glycosyl hydrolase family 25